MERTRRLLLVSAALLCTPVLAQQANIAHFETISDWRTTARLATDDPSSAALSASFSAFGRQFELALESNKRVESQTGTKTADARAWRGTLRNVPASWVRVVTSALGVSGLLWDGTTLYGIDSDSSSGARIFRAADVLVPAGTMSCAMHAPAGNAAAMYAELAMQPPDLARAAGATLNLNLGVVSDPELSLLYSNPEAEMLIRVNNVDGIFSEALGVQITVEHVDVFDDPASDPFTDTTDSEILIEELSVFRGNSPQQDAQGLTHLFTGRDLDGSTVGIAYIGAVCATRSRFSPDGASFGVGLTQTSFGPAAAFLESLIAAHEIGHNFGAPHDGESGACVDAPATGFIMSPSLDPTADEFSQCSIDVISDNLPGASCLTPVANVDVAVSGQSTDASPFTETQFDYVVSVANQGLETAASTSLQINLDAAFTVVSVTPQAGSCGPAQLNVTCDLGDVPAGATRTVNVTLQADQAGSFPISGTISATDDVDATNDSFADSLSISPASDLALITSPQTLTINQNSTIAVTLENRSGVDASGITLTGTTSDGLEINTADFEGSVCDVDADQLSFSCQIATLDGLGSGILNIALRGTETGSQVITLNVSAFESDPDAANNSANNAVDVVAAAPPPTSNPDPQSDPASQGSSGGGGALGPLALLSLFCAGRRLRHAGRRRNANFS